MKKMIFSFLFLTFTTVGVIAQGTAPQPPVNPNAPEISFDKTVHDYGTIFQAGDGTCEFKFTNTGKEPLILSRPQSSCGCTVPTWPQEPVLPGKSDVIKVTYNTNNIGPINKTVTVTSNAKTSRVVLQIKGTVVAKPATTEPVKPTDQGATPVSK
ncbi:MAG: DUF1573 domain-containing protein [Bacteroidales bacterium]|nr:DUF1573 domain-containing protein [Bacteroidales bacterium]MDD4602784.1 DUF1573 domain-containing protein [Bacteroidales bacterium]